MEKFAASSAVYLRALILRPYSNERLIVYSLKRGAIWERAKWLNFHNKISAKFLHVKHYRSKISSQTWQQTLTMQRVQNHPPPLHQALSYPAQIWHSIHVPYAQHLVQRRRMPRDLSNKTYHSSQKRLNYNPLLMIITLQLNLEARSDLQNWTIIFTFSHKQFWIFLNTRTTSKFFAPKLPRIQFFTWFYKFIMNSKFVCRVFFFFLQKELF